MYFPGSLSCLLNSWNQLEEQNKSQVTLGCKFPLGYKKRMINSLNLCKISLLSLSETQNRFFNSRAGCKNNKQSRDYKNELQTSSFPLITRHCYEWIIPWQCLSKCNNTFPWLSGLLQRNPQVEHVPPFPTMNQKKLDWTFKSWIANKHLLKIQTETSKHVYEVVLG